MTNTVATCFTVEMNDDGDMEDGSLKKSPSRDSVESSSSTKSNEVGPQDHVQKIWDFCYVALMNLTHTGPGEADDKERKKRDDFEQSGEQKKTSWSWFKESVER